MRHFLLAFVEYHSTFSRQGRIETSFIPLIWLNGNDLLVTRLFFLLLFFHLCFGLAKTPLSSLVVADGLA